MKYYRLEGEELEKSSKDFDFGKVPKFQKETKNVINATDKFVAGHKEAHGDIATDKNNKIIKPAKPSKEFKAGMRQAPLRERIGKCLAGNILLASDLEGSKSKKKDIRDEVSVSPKNTATTNFKEDVKKKVKKSLQRRNMKSLLEKA